MTNRPDTAWRTVRFLNCGGALLAALACMAGVPATAGQLALSANDGKQPRPGAAVADVRPDTLLTIDLAAYPPKVIGSVEMPVSMIGPPTSIAMARDESLAIVTASQKLDASVSPARIVLGDTISVVDLADPARPKVVQTLTVPAGPTGVSIDRRGRFALVASTSGAVSLYTIAHKRLALAQRLTLNAGLSPVDVAISPDGTQALVSQRKGAALWRLALAPGRMTLVEPAIGVGREPYTVAFARTGKRAYSANLSGRVVDGATPPVGSVAIIDAKAARMIGEFDVGTGSEHIVQSPDGRFLAVTLINGSLLTPGTPGAHLRSLVRIFRIAGDRLEPVATAEAGAWVQGLVWRADGRVLLAQSADAREIAVYRFDGRRLVADPAATLRFDTRPGALATAHDR